jgi:YHS domain-containing protein
MRHLTLFLLMTLLAAGKDPVAAVNTKGGVAVKGYDTVAYFNQSKPVKGSSQFTHEWMGARWQFASQANLDAFRKEPERYAPKFGGYCAWAVSNNYTADIDAEAWKIVDGKLYLNYSKDVQKKWEQDQYNRIQSAEKNWPGLHK